MKCSFEANTLSYCVLYTSKFLKQIEIEITKIDDLITKYAKLMTKVRFVLIAKK